MFKKRKTKYLTLDQLGQKKIYYGEVNKIVSSQEKLKEDLRSTSIPVEYLWVWQNFNFQKIQFYIFLSYFLPLDLLTIIFLLIYQEHLLEFPEKENTYDQPYYDFDRLTGTYTIIQRKYCKEEFRYFRENFRKCQFMNGCLTYVLKKYFYCKKHMNCPICGFSLKYDSCCPQCDDAYYTMNSGTNNEYITYKELMNDYYLSKNSKYASLNIEYIPNIIEIKSLNFDPFNVNWYLQQDNYFLLNEFFQSSNKNL
jgi:hypothetical protein